MTPDLETIRQTLQCDNPSCPCHKPRGHVHCPAHDSGRTDKTPAFSISESGNGKILFYCFNGCAQDQVLSALKSMGLWPTSNKGGDKPSGNRRNSATPTKIAYKNGQLSVAPPSATPCNTPATLPGITLAELSEAKKLPADFLKSLGLADQRAKGTSRVVIPYMNEKGEVAAVRYRLSLDGAQRFIWRTGDRVLPYGLWQLKDAREKGWVLLVEGESDCWTCWFHGLPAIGIPGKSTFRDEWKELFQGVEVYLWMEPDAPELPGKLVEFLPGFKVIQAPSGLKDLSQAHIKGEDVPALVERLKAQAIPAAVLAKEAQDARVEELREAARPVLEAPDPLELVGQAILSQGYGGDIKQPIITYLAATSRLLAMRPGAMPVHLLLVGQASAGKSYLLGIVLRLLPKEAFHTIAAGSPRVLIYDKTDLQYRVVVFGEADSLPSGEDNTAASAIRNLLQDHALHYDTTVKDPDTGEYIVKNVRKPGPSVLITTSTQRLREQFDTRVFSLDVIDTPAKISAALLAQANLEMNGPPAPDDALIAYQGYLQALAPWEASVPFIEVLAYEMGLNATDTRIMRDYARLVSLIKSLAIIRHQRRQRDKYGRVIAQLEDYATAFDLVGSMFEATLTGVTKELQATVQAVGEMLEAGKGVTATTLAARLGIHRGTASRRVSAAVKRGWIVNREVKKGQPWDLAIGEPLSETQGLPSPEMLENCCAVACATGGATVGATPQHAVLIDNQEECCTVAGSTDGSFLPPIDAKEGLKEVFL